MSNALGRAAGEFTTELARYGIQVSEAERCIVWRDLVVNVSFGTPRTGCRRKLRKMIKAAQKLEVKETQETLL